VRRGDEPKDAPRPGISRGGRGSARQGEDAFSKLLADALEDPRATEALTEAWASLDRIGRRALVDAVREDGEKRGLDVVPLLAIWRLLELDDWVFERATAYRGSTDGAERWVLVQDGQALEVRHRPGDTKVEHHPAWESGGAELHSTDLSAAVDRVAKLLWRHRRRGGDLPRESRAFAALFDR